MRRVLLCTLLAGLLATLPVQAQETARQVRSVQTARKAANAGLATPDAPRTRASAVNATKPTTDPRPLRGLDNRHLRRYPSIEAFLAARPVRPPMSLRAAATRVGVAQRIQRAVPTYRAARSAGAGKTVSTLRFGDDLRLERGSNGTIRWMKGTLGHLAVPSGGAGKQAAYTQAALVFAETHAEMLRLQDPADELLPMATTIDDLGYVHTRFAQTYDGLPVWGRDLFIHIDDRGEVYAVNGTYEPTPVGVATTPVLGEAAAVAAVIADLQAEGRWAPVPEDVAAWLDIEEPRTELVLYPDPDLGVRLAYDVMLHPNLLEWYTYLIDAQTGRILNRIARHCTLNHEAAAPVVRVGGMTKAAPPAGPASLRGTFTDAPAVDLNGQTQNLRVYEHDDGLFYKLWDLDNLNQASDLPTNPEGGALTIDANSTDFGENVNLTHVTSGDNTWTDPAGVSAHVNMNIAYTYYKQKHNRNAIDGQDQSIISVIHVTDEGRPMDNAFWSGRLMAYGDGAQAFTPLAGALDVAGHEMTHGVIQNTAGLVYQFQSGALNESFADVFGVMIEQPINFLLGEDIMVQAAALRDLLNPDNPQVLSRQPAHMSQFRNLGADQDNGGVHINSGIPNRAAALILNLLGVDLTEEIYYRALTVYLTRNSQFGDARLALEQAAVDLRGENSSAVMAVRQSFDDVGILSTAGEGGQEGNDVPAQTEGFSLITFMLDDGRIGLLDMSDFENPDPFILDHPDAIARVDAENGDRAQLTTPRDGETIWFINQEGKLTFIALDMEAETFTVNVFDNLFIQQSGDLRNASISPDGSVVALTWDDETDARLYFSDREQIIAQIDLEPETTQEGIEDETVQFPDVVSWSPNPQVPRILFDALSVVPFGVGNTISYWSIYEIDFAAQTIFNLIPAQPTDISIGNITYSNNDPDLVAFNVIDDTGTWDVLIGDFESGAIEALDIPSFSIGASDAQRPSFSPDDGQLVMSSPSLGRLLFYNPNDPDNLDLFDLQGAFNSPGYNPKWFVQGGSGGTSNQPPSAAFSASTTSGQAPLPISFDASASSDPEGGQLTYRWDFGDGSTGGRSSVTHTFTSAGTVTVTLTVTDSGGLSDTAPQTITISAPPASSAMTLRNFDPVGDQVVWFWDRVAPNDSGFVHGTNSFVDQAKATALSLPNGVTAAQVMEVNVSFGFKRDGLTNETYAIEILNGTPQSGPTSVLGRQEFQLAGINADSDANTAEPPTNHVFSQPVTVGSTFFVSVDFGSYEQADWVSAAIVASPQLGQRILEDWEKWEDDAWHNVSDAWWGDNAQPGTGIDGWHMWIEAVVETGTGTSVEGDELPDAVFLSANYPNPFNPTTVLEVELPARMEVALEVVDLLGRTVAVLVEGPMDAGRHGVRFDARGLPSGMYLARLRAGATTQTRKMVLLR